MTKLIVIGLFLSFFAIAVLVLPNIIAKYFCTEKKIKILEMIFIINFALLVFSFLISILFLLLPDLLNNFNIEILDFLFLVFVLLFFALGFSLSKAEILYNRKKEEITINHIMNHLKQKHLLKLKLINNYSNILTGDFIKKVLEKYLWHIELINFEKRFIKLVITDSDLNIIHSRVFELNHENYILLTKNFLICL